MSIMKVWCDAAVTMALQPTATDENERALAKVALLNPDSITDRIAVLRSQIKVLQGYLPNGASKAIGNRRA